MVLWFFHVMKMKLSQVLQLRCSAGEASEFKIESFPPTELGPTTGIPSYTEWKLHIFVLL
jgi:hypothetical protein